jgi:hypothetical protein
MSNEEPKRPAPLSGKAKKLFDVFWDHEHTRPKMGADGEPQPQQIDSLYVMLTGGEDWEENRRKRHQLVGANISYLNKRIKPLGLRIRPSDTLKHAYVIGRL